MTKFLAVVFHFQFWHNLRFGNSVILHNFNYTNYRTIGRLFRNLAIGWDCQLSIWCGRALNRNILSYRQGVKEAILLRFGEVLIFFCDYRIGALSGVFALGEGLQPSAGREAPFTMP